MRIGLAGIWLGRNRSSDGQFRRERLDGIIGVGILSRQRR